MPSEPAWPEAAEVVRVNQAIVADSGEPFGLLDAGLLESALASPRNHYAYGEEDVVTLAVILLLALARDHPFMQGNKRTAFAVTLGFLERCGYGFVMRDSQQLADAVIAAITHEMGQEAFEGVIRDFVVPLESRLG